MDTTSVWRAGAPPTGFGMLHGDIVADVLIIGGGITGVTTALLLAQQGRSVVLLEAQELGSGATGNSTGNIYQTVAQGLTEVTSRWDADVARQVVTERKAAVDFIESQAQQSAQAQFRRCPLVLFAETPEHQASIDEEFEALVAAGCQVERRREVPQPLPRPAGDVLVLTGQAQFQPQAYVAHLARLAVQAGARIHEHSRVLEIDDRARRVATASGTVQAQELVMATHTPKGIRMVHAQMPVHREYGVAIPLPAQDPGPGTFWMRGDERLSVRTCEAGGRRFLGCVGQEQKTGHHNAKVSLMALEGVVRKHFGDAEPACRWSAQNYRAADGLPYIGRDTAGCFVATGFATDGLTWGTVAARLIAQEIGGHPTAFGALCKPTRLSLVKGAKIMLEEVGTMTKSLVQDYLTHRQEEHLSSLAAGDSAILEQEGESVAAWRSPAGELYAVSPVCTHLGCKVHWNSMETTWDCACHGSRFHPDGTVLEGPAVAPLKRKVVKDVN